MAIALINEVMDHAPSTLTPQERVAAMVFAEDAWLHPDPADRNHDRDRHIRTSLKDEKFQRRIGVSSAKKVLELAQALARKGVLENVTRGQKWQEAEYRFCRLAPAQRPTIRVAEGSDHESQQPGIRVTETAQQPGNWGAEASQQPGNWGAAYIPPSYPHPHPPDPAQTSGPTEPKKGAEAESGEPPNPEAEAILRKLDLDRSPGRSEHVELLGLLAAALAAGWTATDLVPTLNRDWSGVRDRVRTALARARDLGEPPAPKQASRASPNRPRLDCPKCHGTGIADDDGVYIGPCADCNP